MANTKFGVKLTPKSKLCLIFVRRYGRLCRATGGAWTVDGDMSQGPKFRDTTIHNLIVRGYLEVTARETVSRKPIGVKPAKEPV